jgi:hypothetical protein
LLVPVTMARFRESRALSFLLDAGQAHASAIPSPPNGGPG